MLNQTKMQPSVKKNIIYRLLYDMLALIVPLITTPYISRVLGAEGIGVYSYTSSIMSYFTLFAALGTVSYGAREIAQHRDNKKEASKLFWEIELMTVITTIIGIVAWMIVILVSEQYKYYFMALVPLLFGTAADISWFYTGEEQLKYTVVINTIFKVLGVILLFILVRSENDLFKYMIIQSIVILLGNVSMWIFLPKFLVRVSLNTFTLSYHFHETLIYFIPTIATSIYTVLDKTLIGVITKSSFENGYYEQATKIINIAKSVTFSSVNVVVGARISYLFLKENYDEIRHRLKSSINFILLVGCGICFGIIAVAKQFVPLFFGKEYKPVVTLLYIMSPLILIIGISNCLGNQYYTPSGHRAQSAKIIILGSLINLVLNLVLIPMLGGKGAAYASLFAELMITVIYVVMSDGYVTPGMIWELGWRKLLAGVLMCVSVMLVGNVIDYSLFQVLCLQIIAGILIYCLLLLIMRDATFIKYIQRMADRLNKH